ncbi:unnamed protein product, partial [Cylicostephanus goldi]
PAVPAVRPVPLAAPAPVIASAPVVAPIAPRAPAAVVAPAVAAVSALASVAAPLVPAHIFPYTTVQTYYHPRTELRNVVKSFAKNSGHMAKTDLLSNIGHLPLNLPFFGHLAEALASLESLRRNKKLAMEKAFGIHKAFNTKKIVWF